ncbi:MAG: formylmethanofuran dehydrogenase subunit B [Promethearchaeia archaeon]
MKRFICCGCSLLCDDVLVGMDGSKIDKMLGVCLKGKERIDQVNSENRITKPMIRKGGDLKAVEWEKAMEKVKELLGKSSNPLLYGFSNSTCEAQAKAIELAQTIDGYIDSNSAICQGKVMDVIKEKGVNLTSLTEILNKSDVITLWGANPIESIPRLINKILFSRGKFRMTGREIKTIIIVDPLKTASRGVMQVRDLALQIEPDKDLELIRVLQDKYREDKPLPDKITGIDKSDIKRFLLNLSKAENGVIIVGQGLIHPHEGRETLNELIRLVNLVNENSEKGRLSLLMMGGHYNMAGFEQMALTLTGKHNSIQFKNDQLQDTDKTLVDKIADEDFDLSFFMGTDPISHFPSTLSKKIASKPIIVADNRQSGTTMLADVVLPTAITGVECGGTAIRLDQVPIEVKGIFEPPEKVPTDEELLTNIIAKQTGGDEE